MFDNIKIFTEIYEKQMWGKNKSKDKSYNGSSGPGSSIDYNKNKYIPFLKQFIIKNNIKKVVDLGSGDWQSSHLIYNNLDIKYYGYDAYEKVCIANSKKYPEYNFIHLDFMKNIDKLEDADLCIIKDVLQHLCNKDINDLLEYLIKNKKYKFILITNCCHQRKNNEEIRNGINGKNGRDLSVSKSPLNKFNPKIVLYYNTKEVSLIKI